MPDENRRIEPDAPPVAAQAGAPAPDTGAGAPPTVTLSAADEPGAPPAAAQAGVAATGTRAGAPMHLSGDNILELLVPGSN